MYDYSSLYSVSTDEYYDAIVNSSTIFKSYSKASKDRGSDDRFKGQHRGSKKAVRRTFGLWQAVYKCQ